jgi:DnaJ-class molecular chaperone
MTEVGVSGHVNPDAQLSLEHVWPCDVCHSTGIEMDPETGSLRRCRVCHGEGLLDHPPPRVGRDPFDGLEEIR